MEKMIETHFEDRQEYIKTGNELTALALKQKKEREEQEKKAKEAKEKEKLMVPYQANNTSANGGDGMPMAVPMQSTGTASQKKENPPSNFSNSNNHPTSFEKPSQLGSNMGKMGFENKPFMPSSEMTSRPFQSNPFMGNQGRF